MVNFGIVLRNFSTPEWKTQYLDYEDLKLIVEKIHTLIDQKEQFLDEIKKFQLLIAENVTKINGFVKRMEKRYLERHIKLEKQLEIYVKLKHLTK